MDIFISNLLSKSIFNFGKWSNGNYANTREHVKECPWAVYCCKWQLSGVELGGVALFVDTIRTLVCVTLHSANVEQGNKRRRWQCAVRTEQLEWVELNLNEMINYSLQFTNMYYNQWSVRRLGTAANISWWLYPVVSTSKSRTVNGGEWSVNISIS